MLLASLEGVTVGGIPIPSRDRWFLAAVAVHVAGGIVAIIAGALAMLSTKGKGRHPKAGTVYFWSLGLIALTAGLLAVMRWPEDNHLAALGAVAIASGIIGRTARRKRWHRWLPIHITGMGVSYITVVTAFYVDNGRHLPLWNRLPVIAFWFLPAVVGAPIILRALRRPRSELLLRS